MKSTMSRTWLLSGVPRSGTSLCCRLAGALPDTVALSEPIRRRELGGMDTPQSACARIGEYAEQARAQILAEGRAPSVQVDGRLDDNRTVSRHTDAGLRKLRSEWGEIAIDKPLSARFTLLIKHNALFAALLPRLSESLKSRNDSALYDDVIIDTLLAALLDSRGRWTRFYSAGDCERVADGIRRGRLKQRRRTGSERGASGEPTGNRR